MLIDAFLSAYENKKSDFGGEVADKPFKPFDVIGEADKFLSEKRVNPIPDLNTIYRVSGLSKLCPVRESLRSSSNQLDSVEVDSVLRKTFDFGTGFHSIVQNQWFGKAGWLVGDWRCKRCGDIHRNTVMPKRCLHNLSCSSDEFDYIELELESKEHFLTGHPDGILRLDGVDYVMELKTSNSKMYEFIKTVRRKPLDAHREQVNMYMFLLKKQHGVIIYFDKDNSQWMQFYEKFDSSLVEKQLKKIAVTKKMISDGVVDFEHRICPKSDCAAAKACSVRKLCFVK